MKKYLAFVVIISIFSISCSNNSNNVNSNSSQVVTSGSWKVTLFTDSGNDETSDFNGYSFSFNTTGSVAATRNGNTQSGTWSINSSSTKFNIDLGPKTNTNHPLGELTDDWKILSVSNTEIKLTDDNVSSNEFLTFTKN